MPVYDNPHALHRDTRGEAHRAKTSVHFHRHWAVEKTPDPQAAADTNHEIPAAVVPNSDAEDSVRAQVEIHSSDTHFEDERCRFFHQKESFYLPSIIRRPGECKLSKSLQIKGKMLCGIWNCIGRKHRRSPRIISAHPCFA